MQPVVHFDNSYILTS